MDLTRAQIVGLFGLATDLPVDTAFDLNVVPDNYGSVTVTAQSEHTGMEVRYKLHPQGGREQLPTVVTKPEAHPAATS